MPTAPTLPKTAVASAPPAGDDCSARVVSRSKPCSNDPDPCKLNSGWDGDEYCLLPPSPDEGIQIHFGPKSYSDPAETDPYTIGPHQVLNESVLAHVGLDTDRYYGRITVHMRPTMEHWVSFAGPADAEEGFYRDTRCGQDEVFGEGGLGGGHNLIYDNPPHGAAAPENAGFARKIAGKSSLCLGIMSVNSTDKPQLREAWINVYFTDEPKQPLDVRGIGVIGELGLALEPGKSHVSTFEGTFKESGRIIQLFGHRQQWATRFAVWLNDDLIYDSWQWDERVTYNYDSITTNPPIDPAGKRDGAFSGILRFAAGDRLKFSCFVENTSDQILRFRNETEPGTMCNMWGSAVGGSLSGQF